jgi:hypothetical protein
MEKTLVQAPNWGVRMGRIIHQVFTHPYTPQENGHVESFHAILATALRHEFFWTLDQLTARLALFYDKYNNERVHSATALLPPRLFWEAYEMGWSRCARINGKGISFGSSCPGICFRGT